MIEARRAQPPYWVLVSLGIGAYAALVAVSRSLTPAALLAAPVLLALAAWWTLAQPHRWIGAFLASALLLPPLPIALGDSGPHPSLLFAALGIFAGAFYVREWRIQAGPLPRALIFLFLTLLGSVASAAFYSGAGIAAGTASRVLLFGISLYAFFFTAFVRPHKSPPRVALLFWLAVASAAIGCADFYYQFPAPAGFGPQFIWTETTRYRRAQGIFYDASMLGNLCAFFLVMIAVAFTRRSGQIPLPRPALFAGGVFFSAALIFSYSRASVINLLAALGTLVWIERKHLRWRRALPYFAVSIGAGSAAGYYFLPQFVEISWQRLSASVIYFSEYGEYIFSGRLESWRVLLRFLAEHPWHAIFGIGYKTLPYSDYIGQTIITDNMYLSMLVETGIIGLAALVWMNVAILRAARKAARHQNPAASMLGTWIFCFWVGECLQMLSADLLTYWRVLPVYFVVLGWAVSESQKASAQ